MTWHRHVNPQDRLPHFNPRRTSDLATHDDTAASMWFELECPLRACKPAQLEVRIIVDHYLHEAYVERPQHGPSPRQICTSRRLAQCLPTITARHTETGVCSTPQKQNKASASSNCTSRTRTNRHNTSDVRCKGGVAPCALGREES